MKSRKTLTTSGYWPSLAYRPKTTPLSTSSSIIRTSSPTSTTPPTEQQTADDNNTSSTAPSLSSMGMSSSTSPPSKEFSSLVSMPVKQTTTNASSPSTTTLPFVPPGINPSSLNAMTLTPMLTTPSSPQLLHSSQRGGFLQTQLRSTSTSTLLASGTMTYTDRIIPGTELPTHIKSDLPAREFNVLAFEEQKHFVTHKTTKAAHYDCNRSKNRYSNIVPYDDSRVVLAGNEGGCCGGEYINASYIDGEIEGTERSYIATQGPLPHTFFDFWRMVVQTGASIIVMLGKEREKDRIKVDRYWPLNVGEQASFGGGSITVKLMSSETNQEHQLIRRVMSVTVKGTGVYQRTVVHYQYEGWPDHGAPNTTKSVRELIKLMYSDHPPPPHSTNTMSLYQARRRALPRPIVCHCSAGVGRTGAFCAIHITIERMYEQWEKNQRFDVNLFRTVLRLRKNRAGMVQQLEQYSFCYETILAEATEAGCLNESNLRRLSIGSTGGGSLALTASAEFEGHSTAMKSIREQMIQHSQQQQRQQQHSPEDVLMMTTPRRSVLLDEDEDDGEEEDEEMPDVATVDLVFGDIEEEEQQQKTTKVHTLESIQPLPPPLQPQPSSTAANNNSRLFNNNPLQQSMPLGIKSITQPTTTTNTSQQGTAAAAAAAAADSSPPPVVYPPELLRLDQTHHSLFSSMR